VVASIGGRLQPPTRERARPVIGPTQDLTSGSGTPADGEADLSASSWRPRSRLLSAASLGLHPGEAKSAWLFFSYFLLLTTCHYVGKSVRIATYVDILGATRLPFAYLLVAVVSFPVMGLYSRLARRYGHRSLIAFFSVTQSVFLVVFYWLFGLDSPGVALAFYVWTTIAFGIGVSQLWSFANHVFDARQARRVFALIGAGGLLGAIPGGQIASLAGRFSETRAALLAAACLSLSLMVLAHLIEARRPARPPSRPRTARPSDRRSRARSGWQAVRGSRLLVLITALVLLSMVVNEMVDLQFGWVVQGATASLGQRTTVFGNLFTLVGVFGFLFQILFTQRIHRALGVGFGMTVLPLSVALASVPLIVAFGLGVAAPIWTAYLLKLSENGFRHSVEQSTRELLFMPVPPSRRLQAKSFIDIFMQRGAEGFAAVILLPIAFGLISAVHLSWMILLFALVWLWLTTMVKREYVAAFRDELRPEVKQPATGIDPEDLTTVATLVASLGSADPRQVLHGLDLLASSDHRRLVPPILVRHDDPEVRCRTLQVLAAAGRADAAAMIEECIADDDARVRTCAVQALARLLGEDVAHLMAARLADPDPRMRAAAVASLMSTAQGPHRDAAAQTLGQMTTDADAGVRVHAAKALAQIPEPEADQTLLQLLYDGDRAVVGEAIAAVSARMERDGPNPIYIPTLISLLGQRRLKHRARQAVVAYGDRSLQALMHFMHSGEEQIWVRRAVPKTVALLSSSAAAEALVESLDVGDDFLRYKVIEALAYLRVRSHIASFATSTITRQIQLETRWYLRSFADLWTVSSLHQARLDGPYAHWEATSRVPTLLQQVLAQRMSRAAGNIFQLLELIYPPRDIQAARRSIHHGARAVRASALEYLDNTLSGPLRRDVLVVIDDAPPTDKLERAAQQYGITVQSPEETIHRLLRVQPEEDPASRHLTFAAMHAIYQSKADQFEPLLRSLAQEGTDSLLRETAAWVLDRLGLSGHVHDGRAAGEPGYTGDGGPMATGMAQIERVVFLQGVELLGSCSAEQLLQMAAIADERSFAKGDIIYRSSEPADAIFLLVDGKVRLAAGGDSVSSIVPGGAFGVLDVLRGQLRTLDAEVDADCRLLVIEAEDFFDLLSNNIEIVRALFRHLTRTSALPHGGVL